MFMKSMMMKMMTMIILVIILLILKISKKSKMNWTKSSPYECGYSPNSPPRPPMSIHFFIITCLFIIFDMEIMFFIPFMMTMKFNFMMLNLLLKHLIIMMLMMTIMYEWKMKMLKWKLWNLLIKLLT